MRTKTLLLLLFCSTLAGAQTYVRPSANADPGSTVGNAACFNGVAAGASYTTGSPAMTAVYSGKTGVGPTGSSATITAVTNNTYRPRRFTGLSGTYAYETLNVSMACSNTQNHCEIPYSVDGGSTWHTLAYVPGGTSQATYSATLPSSTNLTNLQVAVCAEKQTGNVTLTTYDIWVTGLTSPPAAQRILSGSM